MTRIPVNPELLTWASACALQADRRERAGLDTLALAGLSMCRYGRAR